MTKTKKKTGCIIAVIVTVILIVVLIAVITGLAGSAMQSKQMYPYGEAAVKNLASYVNVSGAVSGSDTVNITTELQEKVTVLGVRVGDSVRKGDVLCEFDSAPLQAKFDQLSANAENSQNAEDYHMSILRRNLNSTKQDKNTALAQAQQAIDAAKAARDQAYQTYNANNDHYNQLLAEIAAADPETAALLQEQAEELAAINLELFPQLSQLDSAVTAAYNAYQDAGRAADSAVQAAQDAIDAEQYTVSDASVSEQLKQLQEQIDSCTVLAPADGIVTQINAAEGSVPFAQTLMTIENTSSLVIRGTVGEADILRIAEGMSCEIKTTATDQEIIPGSVQRIERFMSSDAAGGYAVEISIDAPDTQLLIGMSANIKIILDKVEQVLSIPYDAVRGGENDGYFVFACEPTDTDGMVRIVKKEIEIGFEGDYYTEITNGDLKEGDLVITGKNGLLMPEEGAVIPDPSRNIVE